MASVVPDWSRLLTLRPNDRRLFSVAGSFPIPSTSIRILWIAAGPDPYTTRITIIRFETFLVNP
jgi:hypothetical protein